MKDPMNAGSARRRTAPVATLTALAILGATLGFAPAAQASGTGYNNTDPYGTHCNVGASKIHTRYVGGGQLDMFFSGSCGTNWIQWTGPNVCTWKRVQSAYGSWTQWERDQAAWSYSMQIYAPGSTSVEVEYAVTNAGYGGGTCGAGAWDYTHEIGQHGWYTVS